MIDIGNMMNEYRSAKLYTPERILLGETAASGTSGKFGDKYVCLQIDSKIMNGLSQYFVVTLKNDAYGIVTYRATVSESKKEKETDDIYEVKCELMEIIEIIQRRENFKFKVELPVVVSVYDSDKNPIYDSFAKAQRKISVVINDISVSGMFFMASEHLMDGHIVEFVFEDASSPALIEAKILRQKKYGKDKIGYGCKFINLDIDKEFIIEYYIFKKQLEQLKEAR